MQSHIDVYVSQATFNEVQRSFPYLVSKEFASGGGDVRLYFTASSAAWLTYLYDMPRSPTLNGT